MPSIVVLIDCRLGLEMARYFEARGELKGVVVHPADKRTYFDDRDLDRLRCWVEVWPAGLERLQNDPPDYLMSVQFGYRVPQAWLATPIRLPLNVHPGFLPDNKGRAPSAWPILDGTRAGVTLHVMTEGLDEGPWLLREAVPVFFEDTGDTVADRVESVASALLRQAWPQIESMTPIAQELSGSYHSLADILGVTLSEDELQVVDKLRARVYHGHGMRIHREGHDYDLTLNIRRVD